MNTNFKETFITMPQFSGEPPQAILEAIKAPEGFRYMSNSNGMLVLDISSSVNISNKYIELPDYLKDILPTNYTSEQLLSYAYNSQKEIPLYPKDGNYYIDGRYIPTEELVKVPLSDTKIDNVHLILHPPTFPEPFPITLSGNDYEMVVTVERQPNDSLNEFLFESVGDSPLSIKYTVDIINRKFEITFTCKIKYAKSVEEVLSTYSIYNAFMMSEGSINSIKLNRGTVHSDTMIPQDAIEFWKKLYKLEKKLSVLFEIKNDILKRDILHVEQIYRCLIDCKPYKTYKNFLSIRGSFSRNFPKEIFKDNRDLYLEFISDKEYNLLGQKISLHAIYGVFNACLVADQLDKFHENEETELLIEPCRDRKMYESTMLYTKKEDLNDFKNSENYIEILKEAKEIICNY